MFSRSVIPGASRSQGMESICCCWLEFQSNLPFQGVGLFPSTSEPWEGLCFLQMGRRKDSPGLSH